MERARRQTRSQAAPDWSQQECLTLVNEINAVECEWGHALASFQKWQLVVENCNSLSEVSRSLNQCKKKWEALSADFNRVKPWRGSYWSFGVDERTELGLPEEFGRDLFRAIERFLKLKSGDDDAPDLDTGLDSDPDFQSCTSHPIFWQTGPKKQRRKITPRKRKFEATFQPWKHIGVGEMINEPSSTSSQVPELPVVNSSAEVKCEPCVTDEKEMKMAAQISENVELINAILEGNLSEEFDLKLADLRKVKARQIDVTRHKGDNLIDYLRIIVDTLDKLCDHAQECNNSVAPFSKV